MTSKEYAMQAQERVDDALDLLARLEHGDPRFAAALKELEDAQIARASCEERWLGRRGGQ